MYFFISSPPILSIAKQWWACKNEFTIHIKNPSSFENGFSIGAANQSWTGDLILTKDALYLLSYSSVWRPGTGSNRRPLAWQASVLTSWTTGPLVLSADNVVYYTWWFIVCQQFFCDFLYFLKKVESYIFKGEKCVVLIAKTGEVW